MDVTVNGTPIDYTVDGNVIILNRKVAKGEKLVITTECENFEYGGGLNRKQRRNMTFGRSNDEEIGRQEKNGHVTRWGRIKQC